jgi:protein TonB
MPEFPGGEEALHKFIKDKLPFANHRCSGKVIVSFVIDQKGDMEPPRVMKGLDVYCDYQAVWIVSIMPHWKPGMHNNKPVRVRQEVELPFTH